MKRKTGARPAFFVLARPCFLAHGLDAGEQPGFMPRRLVFVDDVAARHAIEHWHGNLVGIFGERLVATFDCLQDLFNAGAQK